MPVRLDDDYPGIDQTSETTQSYIVALLYNYPEYGYRPAEVRELLNLPHGIATTILKYLYEQGCVGRTEDGYYHAAKDRKDLRRYVDNLNHLNQLFHHPTECNSVSFDMEEGTIPESIEDAEIETELAGLESKIEE